MPVVNYTTVNGRILHEDRNGVKTLFMPDTLGNVIETRNMDTGAQTSSTTYWPYGEVRTQTGTNPSPFGFCGVWGYYTQAGQPTYVRARYYRPNLGRWQTVDPLWPDESPYNYVSSMPSSAIDPSGLSYGPPLLITPDVYEGMEKLRDDPVFARQCACFACALDMLIRWYPNRTHECHHKYTHCMACCILSRKFGFQCAIDQQLNQNLQPGVKDRYKRARLTACKDGAAAIINPGVTCEDWCKRIKDYGLPNTGKQCRDQVFPGHLPVPERCL